MIRIHSMIIADFRSGVLQQTRRIASQRMVMIVSAIAVIHFAAPAVAHAGDFRLRADFSPRIELDTGEVQAAVFDATGRLYIAGRFTTLNGHPRFGVARFNADGSLDATYAPGPFSVRFGDPAISGILPTRGVAQVTSLALSADGKLLVAGTFTHVGSAARPTIVRSQPC